MRSEQLSYDQAKELRDKFVPTLQFAQALKERMEALRFALDDPLFRNTKRLYK